MRHQPMKRGHESIRAHNDRPFWQLIVILFDALEIPSGRVCLADSSRSKVHDLVPIPCDICVQLGDSKVCPVSSDHCEHMAKAI